MILVVKEIQLKAMAILQVNFIERKICMKKKSLNIAIVTATLAIAVTIGVSTISPSVQASPSTNSEVQGDVTVDKLPESLRYDSEHPDKIYVNEKVFVKTDQAIKSTEMNEITYDIFEVTDNTNYIVSFDAIYVRSNE